MYVCTYVRTYVCMYVCMYVCNICVTVGVFVGSHGLASAPGLAWAEGLWREDVRVPGKKKKKPQANSQYSPKTERSMRQVAAKHVLPNLRVCNIFPRKKKNVQNGSQKSVFGWSCAGVTKYAQILVFVPMVGERQRQPWLQT